MAGSYGAFSSPRLSRRMKNEQIHASRSSPASGVIARFFAWFLLADRHTKRNAAQKRTSGTATAITVPNGSSAPLWDIPALRL